MSSMHTGATIPPASWGWAGLGPGATWHSGVEVHLRTQPSLSTSNNGIICTLALTFRWAGVWV